MITIASIVIAIITLVKIRSFTKAPSLYSYKSLNALKITNTVFVPLNSLALLGSILAFLSIILVIGTANSYNSYYDYALSRDDRVTLTVGFIYMLIFTVLSITAFVMSIIALSKSSKIVAQYKTQMTVPQVAPIPQPMQPVYYAQPIYQQAVAPAPQAPSQTFCTFCGTPNADGAAYCISCGNAIEKR